MEQSVEDFITSLETANSVLAVKCVAGSFFENLGFEGAFFGIQNQKNSLPDYWATDSVLSWSDAYHQEQDYTKDPLLKYIPHMPSWFYTGATFLGDYPNLTERDKNVIMRAESYGLISGVALSMPFQNSFTFGGWNILSRLKRAKFECLYQEVSDVLQLASVLAHTKIESFARKQFPLTAKLSDREKESLLWLSTGMRTSEIAWKMGIRPVTVDFHIRNARLRLGAKTREQALSMAILSGQIPL